MAKKQVGSSGAQAARAAAAELRARQNAVTRRNRMFAVAGVVALAGLFVVALMFIFKASNASAAEYEVYDSGELTTPTAADASGGILVGPGGVAGADVAATAIRVDIYEDPICPACGRFSQTTETELSALLDSGEVAIYYHPIAYFDYQAKGTRYSTRASSAMATVAEQDPQHFFGFVHYLFSEGVQPAEGTMALTNVEIADAARAAGVSDQAVSAIAEGAYTQWVTQATEKASVDGVGSTPTLRIAGVDFKGWFTPGQISAAVTFVNDYGADAFEAYITNGVSPTPAP